jgi:hypothetical protein
MASVVLKYRAEYSVACVEVYSGPSFLWAELVSRLLLGCRKPFVLTLHGGRLPEFAARWPKRVTRLLRSASAVTAPSRYLREAMIFYRRDIELLPNPIELSCYKFALRERPQASLIWLRSFHAIYNPQLAPQVVAQLKKKCSSVRLTMVGPDKGDRSLAETREIAKRLDVSEQLEIVNGVPKAAVPNVLSKADIFLNTTNVDNTPISVLEAMASGLAIVSTNVGGIPHLLEDERTALLVPPNDPVLMAEAVHRILSEPELGKRLSGNARAKAEEFDWKTILPKWEALFTATAAVVNDSHAKPVTQYLPPLAPPLRSIVASLRGYELRLWRYGPETDHLVDEALERETWTPRRWQIWREERLAFVLNRAATLVPYYRKQWPTGAKVEIVLRPSILKIGQSWRKTPYVKTQGRLSPTIAILEECFANTPAVQRASRLTYGGVGKRFELGMRCLRHVVGAGTALLDRTGGHSWWTINCFRQSAPPSLLGVERGPKSALHVLLSSRARVFALLLQALKDYQIKYIFGYTSSLYALAQHIIRHGRKEVEMTVAITNPSRYLSIREILLPTLFAAR